MKSAPKSALLVLCFALPAFAQQVIALKAARLFDGTSDRVSDYVDIALRNAIANGTIVGPRMLVAVHAISATGGHGDADAIPPARGVPPRGPIDGICNGADACRAAVRYQVKYGADEYLVLSARDVLAIVVR